MNSYRDRTVINTFTYLHSTTQITIIYIYYVYVPINQNYHGGRNDSFRTLDFLDAFAITYIDIFLKYVHEYVCSSILLYRIN